MGAALDDGFELVDQLGELLLGQIHRTLPVEDAFASGFRVLAGQIALEIRHQGSGEHGERPPVVVLGHRGAGFGVDERLVLAHPVTAFDRAAHGRFPRDFQDLGLRERRDVAIHGRRGHVGQPLAQLRGGQLAGAEQGLQDPQPDGVKKKIGGGHAVMISHLITFSSLRMM